jgi:hypothetical protein
MSDFGRRNRSRLAFAAARRKLAEPQARAVIVPERQRTLRRDHASAR